MAIPSSSSYSAPNNRGEYEHKPAEDRSTENGPQAFERAQDPWSQAKLREIYRFSRQLFACHSMDLLLQEIVRQTKEILEISFCRILLPKADGAWVSEVAFPDAGPARKRFKLPETGLAQFIYQRAAEKNSPTLLHRGSSLWNTLEQQTSHIGRAAWLCLVPIVFSGETLGLLELGQITKNQAASFDEEKNQLATFIAEQAAGAIYRIRVANRLQASQAETVLALSKTLETRDDHTGDHCNRMTALAERTAAACHCTEEEIQVIRWSGMLHDIGKVGIPDDILRRPGPLNNSEWMLIQRHPDVGADIVLMVSNLSQVAELIRSHHERFDGKGYPRNLRGSQIPLGARILAVADAYTAMTDGRIYRQPVSHSDAIAELKRCACTHFDPRVVDMFISLFQ